VIVHCKYTCTRTMGSNCDCIYCNIMLASMNPPADLKTRVLRAFGLPVSVSIVQRISYSSSSI
jgi:hypothetical protein